MLMYGNWNTLLHRSGLRWQDKLCVFGSNYRLRSSMQYLQVQFRDISLRVEPVDIGPSRCCVSPRFCRKSASVQPPDRSWRRILKSLQEKLQHSQDWRKLRRKNSLPLFFDEGLDQGFQRYDSALWLPQIRCLSRNLCVWVLQWILDDFRGNAEQGWRYSYRWRNRSDWLGRGKSNRSSIIILWHKRRWECRWSERHWRKGRGPVRK